MNRGVTRRIHWGRLPAHEGLKRLRLWHKSERIGPRNRRVLWILGAGTMLIGSIGVVPAGAEVGSPATVVLAASTPPPVTTPPIATPPEPFGVPGNWTLNFDDEFNGTSLNRSVWSPYWFADGDVSNGTVMTSSNVSESGGSLNLALTSSSGGLVSTDPYDGVPDHTGYQFTYGYLEARIDVPAAASSVANWPAFWATGQDWPTDGELDVMEGLGGQACFHFHDTSGGPGDCVSGDMTGWHTFGASWAPGVVTYYYDGVDVGSISSGITSQPFYIVIENSGYGTVRPSTLEVDYVRVWTAGDTAIDTTEPSGTGAPAVGTPAPPVVGTNSDVPTTTTEAVTTTTAPTSAEEQTPADDVPESPSAILFPGFAALMFGAVLLGRRRKHGTVRRLATHGR